MTDRRRSNRYLLSEPIDARLRMREEVTIEGWDDDGVVVLSSAPARPSDALTLEFPGKGPGHVVVEVAESRPVVAPDGSLRHRVRLTVQSEIGNRKGSHGL